MIYTYRCNSCSKVFEKEVSPSFDKNMKALGYSSSPRCVECKSSNTIKIITPVAIAFVGDGFTKSTSDES